ncbi:MAG: hemolysin family protein [Sphaerochaetaceae bacterium]|jgi:CBS domain containing-hemolysin-like protein|nr:hemolysin family protein [Sphaerochaetaceae bacterium]
MAFQIIAIVVLLFFSAFFSASETAFTSLSFLQVRTLETEKKRTSRLAASLAKNPDLLLTTILIGNNIVNLTASALTTTFAISLWGNKAIGFATGILTLLILIFGEITPKHLAITYNTEMAKFAAYPIRGLTFVLFPVVKIVRWLSSLITRIFGQKQGGALSLESFMHVVDVAEDEGIVDQYESSLVQRVLHFSEAPVKSIMTHRTEVFSLPDTISLKEAFPPIVASGYSRIPIYQETPENIVGILLVRDALAAEVEGKQDEPVSQFIHTPIFVPETRKLDDMLFQFQQEKLQIAVVLDEYGGLSGIVSMEDIVEQLFGEIYDEHETGELLRIKTEANGTYLIKADTTMHQIKDELSLHIDRNDLSCTLAAFLIEQMGSIPIPGEKIELPFGIFTIVSMKGKRIESVRLKPIEEVEEPHNGFH